MVGSEIKKNILWFLRTQLELTEFCFKKFLYTDDTFFLNHAKEFQERSKDLQTQIKKHD